MKVLVIGGGGREHAIVHTLKKSPKVDYIWCAPGNGGIAAEAECVAIKATDIDGVVAFAKEHKPDLVMVAPDDPLALGMVDALEAAGIRAFGPRKNAAIIEGSKSFAKDLMQKYNIPTAGYAVFENSADAIEYIKKNGAPIVIKADGLALGKGVTVAMTEEDAIEAVKDAIEAHAFGVRGPRGLGCAEETGCIRDIDFLVGTFGKAAASAGAYIACCRTIREYLVNRMRTLIFTTALPPTSIAWTLFIVRKLARMQDHREHLARISRTLREALQAKGYGCPSASHIVPLIIGPSADTVLCAELLQRHGFYALPVRPPTVPEGTSRIRFSLTADITEQEIEEIIKYI